MRLLVTSLVTTLTLGAAFLLLSSSRTAQADPSDWASMQVVIGNTVPQGMPRDNLLSAASAIMYQEGNGGVMDIEAAENSFIELLVGYLGSHDVSMSQIDTIMNSFDAAAAASRSPLAATRTPAKYCNSDPFGGGSLDCPETGVYCIYTDDGQGHISCKGVKN